jgi:hypothetical protein
MSGVHRAYHLLRQLGGSERARASKLAEMRALSASKPAARRVLPFPANAGVLDYA